MARRYRAILAVLVIGAVLAIARNFLWWGYWSPQTSGEMLAVVRRRHYPVRHVAWSGIFPFEGGFIPVPDFSWSEAMSLPESAQRMFASHDARFQLMDVNGAFQDRSSEILLLIKSGFDSFEYSLERPKKQYVQAVVAFPDLPSARIFPYRNRLALLVSFFDKVRGVYLLSLTLKSGTKVGYISIRDPQFVAIANEFKTGGKDSTVKEQFCETRRNDFIAFYQRYCQPCEQTLEIDKKTAVVDRFDEFWSD